MPDRKTFREMREVIVPESNDGARLDRALSELFPDQSRSYLARLIEQGHVTLDTKVEKKTSARVRSGQTVVVEFPAAAPATVESQNIPIIILYEDADLVVINKPAGLVVHPAAGHADETLVNALLFHVKDLSGVGGELKEKDVELYIRERLGLNEQGAVEQCKDEPQKAEAKKQ